MAKYQMLFQHSDDSDSSILRRDIETLADATKILAETFEYATKDLTPHEKKIQKHFREARFDNSAGKYWFRYWIEYMYDNEEVKFWNHSYTVTLSEFDTAYTINANSEQDALDEAIDLAEKAGYEGLFLSPEEIEKLEKQGEEYLEEYICGGNHGRYLSSLNVLVTELRDL